jgi:hypothetical protein
VIEHLHLDAAQERHAGRGNRAAPDEDAGVAATAQMPPFGFEDEILELPVGPQRAGGLARAVNHAVANAPRFGRAIRVHPAGQITAVEKRRKTVVVRGQHGAKRCQKDQEAVFHAAILPELCFHESRKSAFSVQCSVFSNQ